MTRRVLQVDQWTSTGNLKGVTIDAFELSQVKGGDAEAARAIFGGSACVKVVEESARPGIGDVWLVDGKDGLEVWKANYDSSD